MFTIRRAEYRDISRAVAALGEAFAQDPLMIYLFGESRDGVRAGVVEFFSILLEARIALDMPALVTSQAGEIVGAAMGYDTSRPAWPASITQEWEQFVDRIPGLAGRLAAYETICDTYQPRDDHYYLGVIGVHPSLQGKGAGKVMLDYFCAQSRADPQSRGVYLDTANPDSHAFYQRNGFEICGEGRLDAAHLWCLFKPT